MLQELVSAGTDGVYLKAIKQTGLKINMMGYAQSNARVSTLMRNFAASPYLENPDLVEIKARERKQQARFRIQHEREPEAAPG